MGQLRYDSIFDAITDDRLEAADLQFRADMMSVIRDIIIQREWTTADTMKALDIPQPRVSELMNGKITKLSSDKLIGYLAKLGYRMKPEFKKSASKVPVQCKVVEKAA